jgi:hypothetical protein
MDIHDEAGGTEIDNTQRIEEQEFILLMLVAEEEILKGECTLRCPIS